MYVINFSLNSPKSFPCVDLFAALLLPPVRFVCPQFLVPPFIPPGGKLLWFPSLSKKILDWIWSGLLFPPGTENVLIPGHCSLIFLAARLFFEIFRACAPPNSSLNSIMPMVFSKNPQSSPFRVHIGRRHSSLLSFLVGFFFFSPYANKSFPTTFSCGSPKAIFLFHFRCAFFWGARPPESCSIALPFLDCRSQ